MNRQFRLVLFAAATAIFAAPLSAQSGQDRFDAAQASFEAKDWAAAAEGFGAVAEALSESQRSGPAGAAVLSRRGEALARLGKTETALPILEEAAAIFAKAGGQSTEASINSYFLGASYELRGEIDRAAAAYADARRLDPDPSPASIWATALARTAMFDDPATARQILDGAIAAAEHHGMEEDNLAALHVLRGRIELNHDIDAAGTHYNKALDIVGRRSTRVSVLASQIRSEASYAEFLRGRRDAALKTLAYSGAGRVMDKTPPLPTFLSLPDCAPLTAVRPDDTMIVDLRIAEHGQVSGVTPIYSSRPGAIEPAFLTSLSETAWNREDLAEVEPFFRASMRVLVRCHASEETQSLQDQFLPYVAGKLGPRTGMGDSEGRCAGGGGARRFEPAAAGGGRTRAPASAHPAGAFRDDFGRGASRGDAA